MQASASLGRARPVRRATPPRAVAADRLPAAPASAGLAGEQLDVVVVGAGVCGLCVAQRLLAKHAAAAPRLLVTEARDRVGGNITTVSVRRLMGREIRRLRDGRPSHG